VFCPTSFDVRAGDIYDPVIDSTSFITNSAGALYTLKFKT